MISFDFLYAGRHAFFQADVLLASAPIKIVPVSYTHLDVYKRQTLHYAPCHADPANGFKVLVALPKGTNTDKPNMPIKGGDDAYLWACKMCIRDRLWYRSRCTIRKWFSSSSSSLSEEWQAEISM